MNIRLVVSANNERQIVDALWGLLAINLRQMSVGRWPDIYSSGIRYQREAMGEEEWQTAEVLLRKKRGDCEDIASYTVAYYRTTGIDPFANIGMKRSSTGWHIIVVRGDGRIEDPCVALGM